MKMLKNWWKYLLVLIILLVGLLGSAMFWITQNQARIIDELLVEVNKKQPGKYEISGSHVAFFKAFPYVSIDLENLTFYADDSPEEEPIYHFKDVYVGFSFDKLFNGKLDVKKIIIENGSFNIVHFQDGSWNLLKAKSSDVMEPQEENTEGDEALLLDLHEVTLRNIDVKKTDYMNDQLVELYIEEAVAGLSLSPDSLTSHLETKLTLKNLEAEGSTLFKEKHLALHFDLAYLFDKQWLHLYKSDFEIEDAGFYMEGDIAVANEMDMDLRIHGRKPDFKLLLSLAPNEVYQKLKNYQNEGEVFFNGRINGKSANGKTPRIDLEFGCENAWFVQKEREKKLDDLNFKGYYTNGEEQNLETSELYIENLKGKPGKGIFAGSFKVKNFLNPALNIDLHADIDLTDLDEFLDLEMFPQVSGKLLIDVTINDVFDTENPNMLIKKLKDTLYTRIEMQDLNFKLEAFPHPFEQVNGGVYWEGGNLVFKDFSGKLKQSDWLLNGELTNLTSILHKEQGPVTASVHLSSKRLAFNELLSFDSALALQNDEVLKDFKLAAHFNTSVNQVLNYKHFPFGEFFIDTLSVSMNSYAHAIKNVHADLIIDSAQLILKDFSGLIDKSDFHLSAQVANYQTLLDTLPSQLPIDFKIGFHSDLMSFNDLFTYKGKNFMPEEYKEEILKDFNVKLHGKTNRRALKDTIGLPDFELVVDDLNGQFTFHPLPLKDFNGLLSAKSQVLTISDFGGKMGKSDFRINAAIKNLIATNEENLAGDFTYKGNILDVDELVIYNEEEVEHSSTAYHDSTTNLFAFPFPEINFVVDVGRINYHKYQLKNVMAKGRLTVDHYVYLDTLSLSAADGNLGIKGYFNGSNPDSIYTKSDLYLDGLSLDKIAYKMDNFGTDYAFNETLHGKIYGKVTSNARLHRDFTPYLEGSEAHIEAKILDGRLENFPPMDMMADYFGEQNVKNIRFGELANVMDFKDNQLSIPKMEISSTLGFINLSGKQSMDLEMDYYIQVPFKLVGKAVKNTVFGVKNDGAANEIIEDDGKKRMFLNVRVIGNPDDFEIELKKDKRKDKRAG